MSNENFNPVGEKSYVATLLLSFFLGYFGLHRFYTGYIGLGILQLLTAGGCGIWALIDFISICFGKFKDVDGNELADYSPTLGKVFFGIWVVVSVLFIATHVSAYNAMLNSIH